MIEKTVIEYLSDELTVPVVAEDGKNPPQEYVKVEKTGSGQTNHIKNAMLAIQSYGASLLEAAALNETVKEKMMLLAELPEIASCRLNTDYNFTDTATKRYRYQAVFDVYYYE